MIHVDDEGLEVTGQVGDLMAELNIVLAEIKNMVDDKLPFMSCVMSAYYINQATPNLKKDAVNCKKAIELFKKTPYKHLSS